MPSLKLQYFEYTVSKLINWYMRAKGTCSQKDFNNSNDLSKLKVIKLHFFVSAVNSNKNNLLETFDKFYAMPLGHVESEIYDQLNTLTNYTIGSAKTIINGDLSLFEAEYNTLDGDIRGAIDDSINELQKINHDLILHSATDLVEISHSWLSWQEAFNNAKLLGKYSGAISPTIIKNETKIFHVQF